MTCFLTTFLRVYRGTQEFLQLHFVRLFVFPISSSAQTVTQSQNQGHGRREASPISSTCFRGKHKQEHMCLCPRSWQTRPQVSHLQRELSSGCQPCQLSYPEGSAEGSLGSEPACTGRTSGNRPCFAWSHRRPEVLSL